MGHANGINLVSLTVSLPQSVIARSPGSSISDTSEMMVSAELLDHEGEHNEKN
jgi:hypothetical protein